MLLRILLDWFLGEAFGGPKGEGAWRVPGEDPLRKLPIWQQSLDPLQALGFR